MEGELIFKILVLGANGSGKKSLISRFVNQNWAISYPDFDYKISTITIQEVPFRFQIWSEIKNIGSLQYYRGAHSIILAFDCTDESSYEKVMGYLENIDKFANPNVFKVLVANKCDLITSDDSNIPTIISKSKLLSESKGFSFFQVSPKEGTNVNELFNFIAEYLLKDFDIKKQ